MLYNIQTFLQSVYLTISKNSANYQLSISRYFSCCFGLHLQINVITFKCFKYIINACTALLFKNLSRKFLCFFGCVLYIATAFFSCILHPTLGVYIIHRCMLHVYTITKILYMIWGIQKTCWFLITEIYIWVHYVSKLTVIWFLTTVVYLYIWF